MERGYGAGRYGAKKIRHYRKIIDDQELRGKVRYKSFTLGTFGSFGKSAWEMIDSVCGGGHPHSNVLSDSARAA